MSAASNLFDAEEILAGIAHWAAIESPTYDPAAVNRMMDEAERTMRGLGAAIERVATDGFGDVVLARLSGADGDPSVPGILVLGHLDTVHPLGTLAGALPLRRDGDRFHGPGVFDMKGGMFLAVHALERMRRAGAGPRASVTFMFVPDEEVGSPATRALIEREAARHRHILVPEPGRPGPGAGTVVTGRHAFLRYTLRAAGRPAHAGSTNRDGRSAIRAMARLIERIEAASDFDRGVTYSVGVVQGGQWVNVVPMECRAEVLCVAPTHEAFDEVRARMAAFAGEADGVRIEVEPGPVRPLFAPHAGTMELYRMAAELCAEQGMALGHGQFGGGSDGNFTGALGLATLDGLGVMGGGAHTHDEHLLVSSLVPRARLLAALFERLE